MKQLVLVAILLVLAVRAWADTFYVAIQGVNAITRYDENGAASSFTNAFVNGPNGLAVDRAGNLYVSTNSNTIEKFSPAGVDLGIFASVGLNFPMALAFDRNGYLYAANFAGNTVQVFNSAGASAIFANVIRPTGLAFDASGNLYVANFGNTIERFAPDGTALGTFANSGLNNPEGLAFDSLGNLYAANNGSDTVEKFSPGGQDLGPFAAGLNGPVGIAFDGSGRLYVVNARGSTITRIDPLGNATPFATTGFTPAFIAVQTPPLKLVNIATRAQVLTGDNVLDAGFILTGSGTKRVLIRALGPSLGAAGVPGALSDPVVELHGGSAILATNDDWKQTQQAAIEATGIPPMDDAESALVQTLGPGTYTVVERGKNGATGVGLVEVYDLTRDAGLEPVNLSTRGFVGSASDVMIAGVIISGSAGGSSNVLVRALGPSLGGAGVADPLTDPVLELRNGNGTLLAANDDWRDAQETAIAATTIPPPNNAEAAILASLSPGAYTAIESGKVGGTGVGLVEIYNLH